jgi:phosphoglycerate-specific signal transduction histidine kinase
MSDFMNSVADIGQRAASYKWSELEITAALSAWIDLIDEAAACALVGAHAHIHAAHGELWHSRIPALWDNDTTATPDTVDIHPEIAQLSDLSHLDTTSKKLIAMYRYAMPALLQSYAAHLATIDVRIDPPTVRILQLCIADLKDHIEQGETVINALAANAP